jgi:hypothetical protein
VETGFAEDLWDLLQQPSCSWIEVDGNYLLLLSALDVGWYVEEPVYLQPRWGENSPLVYHFILRRPPFNQASLLIVPVNPEVDHLVRNEGWRVEETHFGR